MNGLSTQNLLGTWLLAPLLAAAYPVLSLFVQNIDEATLTDLGVSLAVVSVFAIVLSYFFRYIFSCEHLASITSALFIFWFFVYSAFLYLGRWIFGSLSFSNFSILLTLSIIWASVFIVFFVSMKRYPSSHRKIVGASGLIRWICAIFVGLTCLQGMYAFSNQLSVPTVSSSQEISSDITISQPDNIGDLQSQYLSQDVYYLVFDRYADAATLQENFGFDNSEFYSELEDRGFRVYQNARASYPMTLLSMSSTLNMGYHEGKFDSFSDYAAKLQKHMVGKWFIDGGFHYYHIGCNYGPLQKNKLAQTVVPTSFPSSEFFRTLLRMTPIGRVLGHSMKYRDVLRQFEWLSTVSKDKKPTFTYAHFLTPHHPYVFARDGSLRKLIERFPVGAKEPYIAQLVSLNAMILETLDEILENSSETPIIIIQSDEGPYLAPNDDSLSHIEKIAKRTGILSAILIPDKEISEKLPTELAPVNTFRFLFGEYLQAPIDLLPSKIFWWESEPFGMSSLEMNVTTEVKEFDGSVSGPLENNSLLEKN